MITCNDCGAAQYDGALFCSECGRFLLEGPPKVTTSLPFYEVPQPPSPPLLITEELKPVLGSKELVFVIPGKRRRLTVKLTDKIDVGRADTENGILPALDLGEVDGAEQGVSRVHAQIRLSSQGVILTDLRSTNGTLLNNYRLLAERPYLLKSGDEIRFGDLLVHVFFD